MTHLDHERYEARARVMKALAHPTRLFILDRLASGRCSVAQLTRLVGDDMSTVSKHLSVLKAAGLVTAARDGVQMNYGLCTPCVMNFFGCVEAVLRANAREQLRLAGEHSRRAVRTARKVRA